MADLYRFCGFDVIIAALRSSCHTILVGRQLERSESEGGVEAVVGEVAVNERPGIVFHVVCRPTSRNGLGPRPEVGRGEPRQDDKPGQQQQQ